MVDIKKLVAEGYDRIAETYLDAFGQSTVRANKFKELIQDLPSKAKVLDLGCGAGVPIAHDLVAHGFEVTGIDVSARQIALAQQNVPDAHFIQTDMATAQLPDASFDAVSAFYSITHVPSEEHADLFVKIAKWLRPDGRFLASFGVNAGEWKGPWLGTTMYFSHLDAVETQRLVSLAGLRIERAEVIHQDNEPVAFLWITARKL